MCVGTLEVKLFLLLENSHLMPARSLGDIPPLNHQDIEFCHKMIASRHTEKSPAVPDHPVQAHPSAPPCPGIDVDAFRYQEESETEGCISAPTRLSSRMVVQRGFNRSRS